MWPFDPKATGLPPTHTLTAYIMWAGAPYTHVQIMEHPEKSKLQKGEIRCPSPKLQLNVFRCRHSHAKRLLRRFDWQKMPGTLVIRKKWPWLTQLIHAGETAQNL